MGHKASFILCTVIYINKVFISLSFKLLKIDFREQPDYWHTAEYVLKDINKPIGVSEYKLSDFVPEELADTLPSADDIEKRIKGKYEIEE